jgi:hypothetical protein
MLITPKKYNNCSLTYHTLFPIKFQIKSDNNTAPVPSTFHNTFRFYPAQVPHASPSAPVPPHETPQFSHKTGTMTAGVKYKSPFSSQ